MRILALQPVSAIPPSRCRALCHLPLHRGGIAGRRCIIASKAGLASSGFPAAPGFREQPIFAALQERAVLPPQSNLPFARRGDACYNGRRLFREVRPWTRRDFRRRCSRCSPGTARMRACCPGAPTVSRTTCGSRRSCCSRRASRPCAGTTRAFLRPRRTCSRSRRCRRRSCSSSGRGWGTITARARRRNAPARSRRAAASGPTRSRVCWRCRASGRTRPGPSPRSALSARPPPWTATCCACARACSTTRRPSTTPRTRRHSPRR